MWHLAVSSAVGFVEHGSLTEVVIYDEFDGSDIGDRCSFSDGEGTSLYNRSGDIYESVLHVLIL